MKKTIILLCGLLLALTATAQTLNVTVGSVTYQFPAVQTDTMTYDGGTTLTIMGKVFTLTDITNMYVDNTVVTDNTVKVEYAGTSATVTVAGNVARYIDPVVSGAHVSIAQSTDVSADNVGEITYTLSGTSNDGEFYMTGSYKSTLKLSSLTLTNVTPVYSGAAVNIMNGKRIAISLSGTSTLTDVAGGSQKGCLYVKGHPEFKGSGTLNVYGKAKHAIKAGEYIEVKNCTLKVLEAVGDGISCNQYFLIKSGTVDISGTSDDGIQCDIDDPTAGSTGETTDHEDEDSGNIYLNGGSVIVSVTALASKGIKAEGDIQFNGATVTVTASGNGMWDSTDGETKAGACVSSDADIAITSGTINLTNSGSGGKGMKCDGALTITDGDITVKTTGGLYYSNGTTENHNYTGNTDRISNIYYSSPKGIKAGQKTVSGNTETLTGGPVVITGGTINVSTSGYNGEGIESKSTMTISGGTITVNSFDDGINSASDMYIQGGDIKIVAQKNDAVDANANLYISGGNLVACGAQGAECGLDAAEGYRLYITGGTILAAAANNNSVSSTTGSQYVLSLRTKVTGGATITVRNGSTTYATFTVPTNYSAGSGGGGGPWGGGGNLLLSCSGLTNGTTYTIYSGSTQLGTAKASTTASGM